MAYVSAIEVRKRSKLLQKSDISDADIEDFIDESESHIHECIGSIYDFPVNPLILPTGTISTISGSPVIIGLNTLFKTESKLQGIKPRTHLYIVDSNEVIVIQSITNETELIAKQFKIKYPGLDEETIPCLNISVTDSQFYIIPEEICTADKYYSAKLILQEHFSEQSYNQETKAFYDEYDKTAGNIISKIEEGRYYNNKLIPQVDAQSSPRLVRFPINPYRDIINQRLINMNLFY